MTVLIEKGETLQGATIFTRVLESMESLNNTPQFLLP